MPQLTASVPRYRKHHASGQAIVTLSGRDFYLGPHGTKVSRQVYDRLIAEWLASCSVDGSKDPGRAACNVRYRWSPICAERAIPE